MKSTYIDTTYDYTDTCKVYNRLDIDSLSMDAMRNDAGYYNDEDYMQYDTDDIIHALEDLCDTL